MPDLCRTGSVRAFFAGVEKKSTTQESVFVSLHFATKCEVIEEEDKEQKTWNQQMWIYTEGCFYFLDVGLWQH